MPRARSLQMRATGHRGTGVASELQPRGRLTRLGRRHRYLPLRLIQQWEAEMNQTVRITEITPPPLNTRQPWKFKDGNGLILKTFNPVIGRFIQDHPGQLLALDYETQ